MGDEKSEIVDDDTIESLLAGAVSFDQLDLLTMESITDNVRLLNVYRYSEASNLSEFLKLGENRRSIKNYGKKSEYLLRIRLKTFLTNHSQKQLFNGETVQQWESYANTRHIDHERLMIELGQTRKIRNSEWKIIKSDLRTSELANLRISAVAAEIGLGWPISPKSDMSTMTMGDFLDSPLSQILENKGFGRKKLGIYLQCAVYLHKRFENGDDADENLNIPERVRLILKHGRLTEREETVLRLRFGIQEERKHTLAEIKESFGVTRERVRQIESKALRKLRMSRYYEKLPVLLSEERELIWEQLSDGTRLRKQEWMEPLEDRLGFEYQIALEICDVSSNRNPNTSVLANWLDSHFPHDETYWYRVEQPLGFEDKNRDKASIELLEFIEQL